MLIVPTYIFVKLFIHCVYIKSEHVQIIASLDGNKKLAQTKVSEKYFV